MSYKPLAADFLSRESWKPRSDKAGFRRHSWRGIYIVGYLRYSAARDAYLELELLHEACLEYGLEAGRLAPEFRERGLEFGHGHRVDLGLRPLRRRRRRRGRRVGVGLTNMKCMFWDSESYTGAGIGAWNVSSVKDTWGMFCSATSFNGDIGAWDLSSAEITSAMFSNAQSFSRDLRGWNVTPAKAYKMFEDCGSFDLRNLPRSLVGRVHEILEEPFEDRESDSDSNESLRDPYPRT